MDGKSEDFPRDRIRFCRHQREPHALATVDVVVTGRNTLETVLMLPVWPYGKRCVVVLSSWPMDLSAVRHGNVELVAGPAAFRYNASCAQAWFNA